MTFDLQQQPLGHIPSEVMCAADYERLARHFIAEPTFAYLAGGSAHDVTVQANRHAFGQYGLVPRVLADVSGGNCQMRVAGETYEHPLLLAPVAYQRLIHPQGEWLTAQGAAAMEAPMILSSLATQTLESVASQSPVQKWFQFYFQESRASSLQLIKRAQNAGYSKLVVTLDAALQVPSFAARRSGFVLAPEIRAVNLESTVKNDADNGAPNIFRGVMGSSPKLEDIEWLIEVCEIPIWIKGVMHPEDASKLALLNIEGVIVSNHGGRSLDGAPATLAQLPSIREAVGNAFPLLLDSGIRAGSDIFKALALGADGVLIGRLQVYAMSVAGALGVAHMLQCLKTELEICMAMTGCATLRDISPEAITLC